LGCYKPNNIHAKIRVIIRFSAWPTMYSWTGLPPDIWVFRLLKSVSRPMLRKAMAKRKVRMLAVNFRVSVSRVSPIVGRIIKDENNERKTNPSINFGNLYQIWMNPGFSFFVVSIFVTHMKAITKAINAIMTFCISFITVATSIACSPSNSPAATTAPVESTVPPIHAPPTR